MDLVSVGYSVYVLVSVAMTVWVARTLFRNGRVFLVDAFRGNEPLADSVNRLLVVGFYLLNIGFIALFLRSTASLTTIRGVIEELSYKIGIVLLVLGFMHLCNVLGFSKMRRRALLIDAPPPASPSSYTSLVRPE